MLCGEVRRVCRGVEGMWYWTGVCSPMAGRGPAEDSDGRQSVHIQFLRATDS